MSFFKRPEAIQIKQIKGLELSKSTHNTLLLAEKWYRKRFRNEALEDSEETLQALRDSVEVGAYVACQELLPALRQVKNVEHKLYILYYLTLVLRVLDKDAHKLLSKMMTNMYALRSQYDDVNTELSKLGNLLKKTRYLTMLEQVESNLLHTYAAINLPF
jgi:hypothetical protein